jgi:hypothetical protein
MIREYVGFGLNWKIPAPAGATLYWHELLMVMIQTVGRGMLSLFMITSDASIRTCSSRNEEYDGRSQVECLIDLIVPAK